MEMTAKRYRRCIRSVVREVILLILMLCNVSYSIGTNPVTARSISSAIRNKSNCLIVYPSDDLQDKYDWLKSSDRDAKMGTASDKNRRTLMLMPGKYDRGSTEWLLDVDYIDPTGFTGNPADIWITGDTAVAVVRQTAGDVQLSNFTIETTGDTGDTDVGFALDSADNSKSIYQNMYFVGTSGGALGGDDGFPVFGIQNLNGTWKNCHATNYAWRVAENKELNATMIDCWVWWGMIGDTSYGRWGENSFGGDKSGVDVSGNFYGIVAGDKSFGGCGSLGADCSGYFQDCTVGDKSFAISHEFSGTAIRCFAGEYSFAGGASCLVGRCSVFSGITIDCVAAGEKSFGLGGYNATCKGRIINCRLGTVRDMTEGLIYDCNATLQLIEIGASLTTTMSGGNNSNITMTMKEEYGESSNNASFRIVDPSGFPDIWSVVVYGGPIINVFLSDNLSKTASELETLLEGSGDVMTYLASVDQVGDGSGNIEWYSETSFSGGADRVHFSRNSLPTPVACVGNTQVNLFYNGQVYTNEGANADIEWEMDPAISGYTFTFRRTDFDAGKDVRIDPNGTDHIYKLDGTDCGAGKWYGSNTGVDAYWEVVLTCSKDGIWRASKEIGTFETEP